MNKKARKKRNLIDFETIRKHINIFFQVKQLFFVK